MTGLDILTMGEPLAEFAEVQRNGETVMLPGFGGDALNVAVAGARQGCRVGMCSAVGDDLLGRRITDFLAAERIDRAALVTRPGGQTGMYFITYGPDGHNFAYARKGSAATELRSEEVPLDLVRQSRVFHFSGVSQAISPSACDAAFTAMQAARAAGRLISYDINLRLKLWPLDRARAVIMATVGMVDILRPGLDDARILTGIQEPEGIVDHFLRLGARIVAMTLGEAGALIATGRERRLIPGLKVQAVDATGAGDCFTGAFLAEYLRTSDPFAAGRYANIAAALKTRGHGAVGSIPHRGEVEAAAVAAVGA